MATQNFTIPEEIWKDIPEFPGYQVSNHGRVRSFWIRGSGARVGVTPRILRPDTPTKGGYLHITLKGNRTYIHQLVLLTFIGPCPPGMEACHNDGNSGNNTPQNLRWDSRSNNQLDKRKHGTVPNYKGEEHPGAKLTEDQIREIRKLYAHGGFSMKTLGKMFGVVAATICMIVNRKRWGHI